MATHSRILAWRIPMDRGDGQAAVHGVTKSQACLSTRTHKILLLLSSVMDLIFILLCPLVAGENVFAEKNLWTSRYSLVTSVMSSSV